jgi:MerR family transcriptional regulator, mercuric resistance operon regulatory protein
MAEAVHIGKAARLAGISVDAIRFYQKLGLLETPRSAGGYRLFNGKQIRNLAFVRHAQELGFSLNEIKGLLSLRQRKHVCPEVRTLIEHKLKDVREKIRSLAHLEEELNGELRNCKRELRNRRRIKHDERCPLLDKLQQPNGSNGKHAANRSKRTRK